MAHENTSAACSARNAKVYKIPTHLATQRLQRPPLARKSLALTFSAKTSRYLILPVEPDVCMLAVDQYLR